MDTTIFVTSVTCDCVSMLLIGSVQSIVLFCHFHRAQVRSPFRASAFICAYFKRFAAITPNSLFYCIENDCSCTCSSGYVFSHVGELLRIYPDVMTIHIQVPFYLPADRWFADIYQYRDGSCRHFFSQTHRNCVSLLLGKMMIFFTRIAMNWPMTFSLRWVSSVGNFS